MDRALISKVIALCQTVRKNHDIASSAVNSCPVINSSIAVTNAVTNTGETGVSHRRIARSVVISCLSGNVSIAVITVVKKAAGGVIN